MYTVLYILNAETFKKEIGDRILSTLMEDNITFTFEDKETGRSYVLIPCDSTNYGDNLEEILEFSLDSEEVDSVAEKIRDLALDVIEM